MNFYQKYPNLSKAKDFQTLLDHKIPADILESWEKEINRYENGISNEDCEHTSVICWWEGLIDTTNLIQEINLDLQ